MLEFRDILVTPFTDLLDSTREGVDHRGGPHWPDFESQTDARHQRSGRPIDVEPEPWSGDEPAVIEGPVAWAGPTVNHFGHQLAEFSMRLIPTDLERPGVPFLFGFRAGRSFPDLERATTWFRELLEWCGITQDRVIIVRGPVLARHLVVAPQAEQLDKGPSEAHLVRMDAWAATRLPRLSRAGATFVSRAGLTSCIAGERYLETVMRDLGVAVVRPETLPLRDQLRMYATSELLLFTEGSAIHGLQLLGRGIGDVVVFNRRRAHRTGATSVAPRARSLTYAEVTSSMVMGLTYDGQVAPWLGISLFDEDRLLDTLERVGIPARDRWDGRAFRDAQEVAVQEWLLRECASDRSTVPGFREQVRRSLADAGLGRLEATLDRAMHRGPTA